MAEPLKYMYNPHFFETLCPVIKKVIPDFNCNEFIFGIFNTTWPDLELKQRVRHIAVTLHHFLPEDFKKAAKILVNLSKALREGAFREQSFQAIFLADYIEVHGLNHPQESLDAMEEITKLVSAEFAIRHFIIRYPEKTMERMLQWSKNEHPSVRRLSSEGCRPRLPWAIALQDFKKDPTPILPILENLKQDTSDYVRRSVANNLNDIAKDHPEVVLEIVKRWQGTHPDTDKIIKHGCRTLLKKGHINALVLHGFNPKYKADIKSLNLSKKKVKIGDTLDFGFDFTNKEKQTSNFRLEYTIDFVTSSGKRSPKIFKIAENSFEPGKTVTIRRKQSFKDLTTRRHFKGKHMLSIVANGKKLASAEFMIC
ncbi:DNA alkylation repair protein [Chryseosolibacter indicus]|uniref:DNA alkylation repair protein n=1 Tax=Chryseosolibacter indicus TaxID=2782351 RepID=A0ABS5VQM8_9BACT|nr:DNA alkylation repair protein [Chryseosolibacter indicus]MBT1703084.1 DNA alkylation repair protein [Chryseosolibacter indicus]